MIERLEAEIATELPPHVRAFAEAYVRGAPLPPAPEILLRRSTIAAATGALRAIVAPVVIESSVATERAGARTWTRYRVLARARDAVAMTWFGMPHVALMHELHGSQREVERAEYPEPVAGWLEPDGIRVVRASEPGVAMRYGACKPRTFVVEPGREVIVALPEVLDTPALRFMALHEFGHARAALASARPIARADDERAAARAARAIEEPGHPWFSQLAAAARVRRKQLAQLLDALERGAEPPVQIAKPPAALWEDPGAQSAYVAAENPL